MVTVQSGNDMSFLRGKGKVVGEKEEGEGSASLGDSRTVNPIPTRITTEARARSCGARLVSMLGVMYLHSLSLSFLIE